MTEHVVRVRGEPVTIAAFETEKGVWQAVGNYLDGRIEVEGPTEAAAISSWVTRASYWRAAPTKNPK